MLHVVGFLSQRLCYLAVHEPTTGACGINSGETGRDLFLRVGVDCHRTVGGELARIVVDCRLVGVVLLAVPPPDHLDLGVVLDPL